MCRYRGSAFWLRNWSRQSPPHRSNPPILFSASISYPILFPPLMKSPRSTLTYSQISISIYFLSSETFNSVLVVQFSCFLFGLIRIDQLYIFQTSDALTRCRLYNFGLAVELCYAIMISLTSSLFLEGVFLCFLMEAYTHILRQYSFASFDSALLLKVEIG